MRVLSAVFLWALTAACSPPEPFPQPENPQAVSLKVINYNLWHGLGTGYLKREELEPPSHKQARFQEQIRLIKSAEPDILFLQEVHPVSSRSKEMAKTLEMSRVFQQTNCGMSFFGLRLPVNLTIGIAVLARPPLQLKKILGLKLSGPPGFCNPYLTFQYAEFRYALFALAHHPQYGSFLLVNTHFHHGVEWSDTVREKIKEWEEAGTLTAGQKQELEETVSASNARRANELNRIFSKISELKKRYGNLPLILAGDLNSTTNSPIYKKIIETHHLKDSAGNYASTPYTWNPEENKQNHKFTEKFGVSVPTFGKAEVEAFFKEYDRRQRRIDYVFVSPEIEVISSALFADKPNEKGVTGSDHFGVEVLLKAGE